MCTCTLYMYTVHVFKYFIMSCILWPEHKLIKLVQNHTITEAIGQVHVSIYSCTCICVSN